MPQVTCEADMPPYCAERLKKIDERLEDGDKHFTQHDKDITTLSADMKNLTKAIDAQTKAIWGACGTALVLLVGFFLWFVEHNIK